MKLRANLLALLACAAAGQCALARPPSLTWIDVPFVAQVKDGCGSASISMVMEYWAAKAGLGRPPASDAERIQRELFSPREGGIRASAMKEYFAQSGYRVFAFQGTWQDLERQVARGRPLIVSLRANALPSPLHYVVIVGVDSDRGYVFVNDPAQQKMLRVSREGFESQWNPTHNWTLLAVPLSEN